MIKIEQNNRLIVSVSYLRVFTPIIIYLFVVSNRGSKKEQSLSMNQIVQRAILLATSRDTNVLLKWPKLNIENEVRQNTDHFTRLPFTLVAQSKKSSKLMFGISPIKKKFDFDIDPVTCKKTSFLSFDYESYFNNE